MKKHFLIVLWFLGVLYGCIGLIGGLYGAIHLHRITVRLVLFVAVHSYVAWIAFQYLREEPGGPVVDWKRENPLPSHFSERLRALWK